MVTHGPSFGCRSIGPLSSSFNWSLLIRLFSTPCFTYQGQNLPLRPNLGTCLFLRGKDKWHQESIKRPIKYAQSHFSRFVFQFEELCSHSFYCPSFFSGKNRALDIDWRRWTRGTAWLGKNQFVGSVHHVELILFSFTINLSTFSPKRTHNHGWWKLELN